MIELLKVKNRNDGNLRAHAILKEIVDRQTLLALSGGTSPDYQKMIIKPADILPSAACLVDERYGQPFHNASNELLIKNSGLINWFNLKGIDFYKILEGKRIAQTAKDYNQLLSKLLAKFPKKVAVMGIGNNLHTAGIFPQSQASKSNNLVIAETVADQFPQRITMTFKALAQFTGFIILMFGRQKREAARIILDESEKNIHQYPAIFYRQSAAHSYLITDLKI